jgi:hypothetical protein
LLFNEEDGARAAVFGELYASAMEEMQQTEYQVRLKENEGFPSADDCAAFARDNHLDKKVYLETMHGYLHVDMNGHLLAKHAWKEAFSDVLFYLSAPDSKGKQTPIRWEPSGVTGAFDARSNSEMPAHGFKPLYHRDYFTPTGYFDERTQTFNAAKPSLTFAKKTGADTWFIWEYLRQVSGPECYKYVVRWLREKLLNPMKKIEVVPIFRGAQGTGKTTFGEVICKALYGKDNVKVTDQFDATSRFNADYADALVVCIEEKTLGDKRNLEGSIKNLATASEIRKEKKGVDPVFQPSGIDLVMTTNDFVPMKFESKEQRRFMVMEGNDDFVRRSATSGLAEEVFTKLYGVTKDGKVVGPRLIDNTSVLQQFKFELFEQKDCEGINVREFPHTEAYNRCFDIPRTNEYMEIEATIKSLMPFIANSLVRESKQVKIVIPATEDEEEDVVFLDTIVPDPDAFVFARAHGEFAPRVALCKPVVFSDLATGRSYSHSVVDKVLLDLKKWMLETYHVQLLNSTAPPSRGYRGMKNKFKYGTTAWFAALRVPDDAQDSAAYKLIAREQTKLEKQWAAREQEAKADVEIERMAREATEAQLLSDASRDRLNRIGQTVRYNDKFVFDKDGEFETLNELMPGCTVRSSATAAYMDCFLLEADDTSRKIEAEEQKFLNKARKQGLDEVQAEELYANRLRVQDAEATRLFDAGIACRVVYSGSKSIHILVRVSDSPTTLAEREWLDAYLKETLSDVLMFDMSTRDPSRLTRAPVTLQRVTEFKGHQSSPRFDWSKKDEAMKVVGTQRLLAEDWRKVYDINWRPLYNFWQYRPKARWEERKRMLPTKPIYREAAQDLLTQQFFRRHRWNGLRQETFFPAYRLLRAMGYTHEEIWTDITQEQLQNYYKPTEVGYWTSRERSQIVREIDQEFDERDREAEEDV